MLYLGLGKLRFDSGKLRPGLFQCSRFLLQLAVQVALEAKQGGVLLLQGAKVGAGGLKRQQLFARHAGEGDSAGRLNQRRTQRAVCFGVSLRCNGCAQSLRHCAGQRFNGNIIVGVEGCPKLGQIIVQAAQF